MEAFNQFAEYVHSRQDLEVKKFPLVSLHSQIYLLLLYLISIKVLLPNFMKNREPFNLRKVIIIYNFLLVVANAIFFYKGLQITYFSHYNFWCQPLLDSSAPENKPVVLFGWLCFMSKWVDCLDTIFFALRKKYNQITFLHVFHHTLMPIGTWYGYTFFTSGHGAFGFIVNSLVHVIMYSYYMLSAFGPEMQKRLNPWKRYLTIVQIVQFIAVFWHTAYAILTGCDYPVIPLYLELFYCVSFLILFCNFYYQTYIRPKKVKSS